MRSISRLPRLSMSMVKNRTETPGRASGVSAGVSSRSIPASHLQAMTDVAKPVSLSAASRAHLSERAVITSRAARMPNASAKVSWMKTPRISTSAGDGAGRAGQSSDRIVLERHRRILIEVAPQPLLDGSIEFGSQVKSMACRGAAQLPFLHDERAALHHVARRREHLRVILVAVVDGDIRVGAHTQMSFRTEAEQSRRPGARHDGNLLQRVLASDAVAE